MRTSRRCSTARWRCASCWRCWSSRRSSGWSRSARAPRAACSRRLLILGGALGVPARAVPARAGRLLGDDRHGRHHERRDARAADRRAVRGRADRPFRRAARDDRRLGRRLCDQRADHAPLDPDREDRAARPPYPAGIYRRSARFPAGRAGDDARSRRRCRATCRSARPSPFSPTAPTHRSYPVVDDGGRLLGLVSRSDALRWQVEGDLREASLAEALSDASQPFAYPHSPIGEVADLMVETGIGRIPIVDAGDRAGGRHPLAPRSAEGARRASSRGIRSRKGWRARLGWEGERATPPFAIHTFFVRDIPLGQLRL